MVKLLDKGGDWLDSQDIEWGTSELALLGQANKQIKNQRKDMHKSDLDPKYHYLASSSLPYTEFLYGEDCDVNKNVREINDLNSLVRSLAKPFPAQVEEATATEVNVSHVGVEAVEDGWHILML